MKDLKKVAEGIKKEFDRLLHGLEANPDGFYYFDKDSIMNLSKEVDFFHKIVNKEFLGVEEERLEFDHTEILEIATICKAELKRKEKDNKRDIFLNHIVDKLDKIFKFNVVFKKPKKPTEGKVGVSGRWKCPNCDAEYKVGNIRTDTLCQSCLYYKEGKYYCKWISDNEW